MDQYYTVFNYRPPIPQKYLKSQDIKNSVRDRDKVAPKFVLSRHSKEKTEKFTSLDALIMDNLEKSLATTVDKARGNTSGAIVEIFVKPRASTMFGHTVYSLDGPGPSMAVSGPHEEFFNSSFVICIGGKHVNMVVVDQ